MTFTKSELKIICRYAADTKAETLDRMRGSVTAGTDDLTKAITENAVCKIGKIPEPECSGIIHNIQNYFNEKPADSIRLQLEMAKVNQSVFLGHDLSGKERFRENTRHMITFDVLRNDSIVGSKGERYRCFLSDEKYENAKRSEQRGEIRIKSHAKVTDGMIYPDKETREMVH